MEPISNNPGVTIATGYHVERGTEGKIVKLYSFDPADNKMHFQGYEVREYSNFARKWYALKFSSSLAETVIWFNKYFE